MMKQSAGYTDMRMICFLSINYRYANNSSVQCRK